MSGTTKNHETLSLANKAANNQVNVECEWSRQTNLASGLGNEKGRKVSQCSYQGSNTFSGPAGAESHPEIDEALAHTPLFLHYPVCSFALNEARAGIRCVVHVPVSKQILILSFFGLTFKSGPTTSPT